MLRFSAKMVVVLAAICFIGLVMLQLSWLRSAYEGELAMHQKAGRQFEAGLQLQLKQDETFKTGLRQLLDNYSKRQKLTEAEQQWFNAHFRAAVLSSSIGKEAGLQPENFELVDHRHRVGTKDIIGLLGNQVLSKELVTSAGNICIHCVLGLTEKERDQYNFQLALMYGKATAGIYSKLGLLIAGSFLLLILLGSLFWQVLKRYGQEKKLSEAKNDFINNLSHELQTPVFAIQMANKIVKEKTIDRSDVKPLVEIIEKETHQLKQHAGKILELASLETEQVELNRKLTELNAFIAEKRATIELMVQSRQGELIIRYDKYPLYSQVDHVYFNNVLMSLAENAIKYRKDKLKLLIETGEKAGMIFLTFTDNGIGIEQQYLPYVFDKFYRVPDVERNGNRGFGLGLSYVRQIVAMHQGKVSLSSEAAKGTSVTVLLPKSTEDA